MIAEFVLTSLYEIFTLKNFIKDYLNVMQKLEK